MHHDQPLFEPGLPPDGFLSRGDATAFGFDLPALSALMQRAAEARSDAVILIREDRVLAERYFGSEGTPIEIMSVTKSIVSIGIEFLIQAGEIKSLDTPLSAWLPGWDTGLASGVTLRHVLTQTSGIPVQGATTPPLPLGVGSVQALVTIPPGTRFEYNNRAVQLLSHIVATVTGCRLDQYIDRVLFAPLGIVDWAWDTDASGSISASAGLRLTARDLARIGLFMACEGQWYGNQLLDRSRVRELISPAHPASPSYGLLWWLRDGPIGRQVDVDVRRPSMPKGRTSSGQENLSTPGERPPLSGYYADGWLGQRLVVYPALKIVAVRLHRRIGGEDEHRHCGLPSFLDDVERSFAFGA